MRVDHRGSDIGMAENVFQGAKVTASHDEVRREGMPQDMGELAWSLEAAAGIGILESTTGRAEKAISGKCNGQCLLNQGRIDRNGPVSAALGGGVNDAITQQL